MKRLHFFVSGNVQGVCYRHYSVKKAREMELKGFIRNLPDGRVEILAEGEDAKINAFLDFCKKNPGHSTVEGIEAKEEKKINKTGLSDFEIKWLRA